ncbi:hypothetical protein ACIP1V_03985 [Kocuria marina]
MTDRHWLVAAALLLPMLAMVFMSAGVSNATVAPPLVPPRSSWRSS